MRTSNRSHGLSIATLCASCVVAATLAVGVRADLPTPVVQGAEGQVGSPWIDVFYPLQQKPPGARVVLVASGATSGAARRVPIHRRPYYEDDQTLSGRAAGRLKADQVYDVEIRAPGQAKIVLPAAFTARAPRFASLDTTTAAPGESVFVTVDFAPASTQFFVNGLSARVVSNASGDGSFAFEVPRTLPRGTTVGKVTAAAFGFRVRAPVDLTISSKRHELSAVVDGAPRMCTHESYAENSGNVFIQGSRIVSSPTRSAAMSFVLSLPVPLASLTAPTTFTQADGGFVEWGNTRDQGAALPGTIGVFASATYTLTIDAIDGTRIRGTFAAHVTDRMTPGHDPDGRNFDIVDGRFDVDLE